MPGFFPRQTIEIRLEEPKAFRKLSFSLLEMAVITGVLLRLYRSLTLSHDSSSWLYIGGTVAVGMVFLVGMATAHLANYPLHQWLWRAPAFWLVEVAAEMATSLLLIWAGREPTGTVRAHFVEWPGMVARTLLWRGLAIVMWALFLAAIVHFVRTRLVHEDEEPMEISS